MAETDKHRRLMTYCVDGLTLHFADRTDEVYVSGNNFVFWEEGNPKARVSPDVYVVFGVEQRQRDSYKAWEENGSLPAVVIEITSRKTYREDTDTKRPLYEQVLKVPEYFQFDPTGDYLDPRLQGLRLNASGAYQSLSLATDRLRSEQLGLDLVMEGDTLRLYDPDAGRFLPSLMEAEARANDEAQARTTLEAEVARLRAELEAVLRRQA